ncbi:hypothetical protein [Paenibacillus piri]|uniref:DUF4367 domain-containing protein n=1 Tax=Paenibacillus piri TaxID=2547395 RepID=A0A4R5KXT0_9BACL|nr:hypothetical protein [Paenibacillus piri]TDG00393.1 hypothetical protein E1757_01790 [Paenibacillus piri]
MSIENQLKAEFQRYSDQLQYPRQLDDRIALLTRKGTAARRGIITRIALIAACIFLFSGIAYASNLLYTMQSHRVSVEVFSDAQAQLPDSLNAEIRSSFQQIRDQLTPGESAIMYVSELDKRKLPALIKVTQPVRYTDPEECAAIAGGLLKKPAVLPQDYVLAWGEKEASSGMIDAHTYTRYKSLLEKQAADTKQNVVWQRAAQSVSASEAVMSRPGLIYVNSNQDRIEIRFQVMPTSNSQVGLKISTGTSTTAEKIDLSGKTGFYTRNNSTFLSDTGKLDTISWVEELSDGQTALYEVSTSSSNVSKAELLLIADHMK